MLTHYYLTACTPVPLYDPADRQPELLPLQAAMHSIERIERDSMRGNESSIKVSLTDDEVIFDIFEKQPWGRPDIRRTVPLALDQDPALPLLPDRIEAHLGYERVDLFRMP